MDSLMSYKEVGERIAALRVKGRYTREYFARQVGISTKFLYEIEAGRKGFSVWVLYNISQVLSVSCDYLLTGRKDSFPEKIGRIIIETYAEEERERELYISQRS